MFAGLIAKIVWGVIRTILASFGGSLVANGLITSEGSQQAIGAIITVLTIAWSAYQKYSSHKEKAVAVANATVASQPSDDLTGAKVPADRPIEVDQLPPPNQSEK